MTPGGLRRLRELIRIESTVRGAMFGRVLRYDVTDTWPTVDVQPIVRRRPVSRRARRSDSEPAADPPISRVPLMAMGFGTEFEITAPCPAGSLVLLIILERSSEEIQTDPAGCPDDVTPFDARRFDLSDAVAIPISISPGQTDDLVIRRPDATAEIRMQPDGVVIVKSDDIRLGSDAASNFIANATDVLAELNAIKTAFDLHTHSGVTTGAGVSGVAAPMGTPSPVAFTKVKAE